MPISDHEKDQIRLIDNQVKMLQDRNASDDTILNTLIDFVADTKCIVENSESKELDLHLRAYNGFAHFVSLVSLALIEG